MNSWVARSRRAVFFQLADGLAALGFLGRQVAVEGEALAAQTRGHQRQQNRRRTDQRDDGNAFAVRGHDQRRAGVGHRGAARFGQQADIVSGLERRQTAPGWRRPGCAR